VIEKLQQYIQHNQTQLQYVRSLSPQNDKWTGTVDYAVARFNSILLKLINTPLKLDEHYGDIEECQRVIDSFVKHIRRYYEWPAWFKWYPKICIHGIGTRQIPRIKNLLNSIDA
jgi:hypothetical protein